MPRLLNFFIIKKMPASRNLKYYYLRFYNFYLMEMEYAIIEASGRQFWVEPKKFIEFNRLTLKIGSTIVIRRILFAKTKTITHIGQPYLQNILVKGKISKHSIFNCGKLGVG